MRVDEFNSIVPELAALQGDGLASHGANIQIKTNSRLEAPISLPVANNHLLHSDFGLRDDVQFGQQAEFEIRSFPKCHSAS